MTNNISNVASKTQVSPNAFSQAYDIFKLAGIDPKEVLTQEKISVLTASKNPALAETLKAALKTLPSSAQGQPQFIGADGKPKAALSFYDVTYNLAKSQVLAEQSARQNGLATTSGSSPQPSQTAGPLDEEGLVPKKGEPESSSTQENGGAPLTQNPPPPNAPSSNPQTSPQENPAQENSSQQIFDQPSMLDNLIGASGVSSPVTGAITPYLAPQDVKAAAIVAKEQTELAFKGNSEKNIPSIDLNNDGQLSKKEIEAYLLTHKNKLGESSTAILNALLQDKTLNIAGKPLSQSDFEKYLALNNLKATEARGLGSALQRLIKPLEAKVKSEIQASGASTDVVAAQLEILSRASSSIVDIMSNPDVNANLDNELTAEELQNTKAIETDAERKRLVGLANQNGGKLTLEQIVRIQYSDFKEEEAKKNSGKK